MTRRKYRSPLAPMLSILVGLVLQQASLSTFEGSTVRSETGVASYTITTADDKCILAPADSTDKLTSDGTFCPTEVLSGLKSVSRDVGRGLIIAGILAAVQLARRWPRLRSKNERSFVEAMIAAFLSAILLWLYLSHYARVRTLVHNGTAYLLIDTRLHAFIGDLLLSLIVAAVGWFILSIVNTVLGDAEVTRGRSRKN